MFLRLPPKDGVLYYCSFNVALVVSTHTWQIIAEGTKKGKGNIAQELDILRVLCSCPLLFSSTMGFVIDFTNLEPLPCILFSIVKHRATTHTDLVVRAKKLGVDVKVVHNASVMNAVGVCGLQLYRYGETVSIPFFTETWRPSSFYEKIQRNRVLGLHTLCLLGKI